MKPVMKSKKYYVKRMCKYADKIKTHFSTFNIEFNKKAEDYIGVFIKNPCTAGRDIMVVFDEYESTLYFSYQHVHVEYRIGFLRNIINLAEKFISNEYAAVEFFKDGKNAMGGHRSYKDIDFSTAESIASIMNDDYPKKMQKKYVKIAMRTRPNLTKNELMEIVKGAKEKHTQLRLNDFKKHQYCVCVECWDSSKDKYVEIIWDGVKFFIMLKNGDKS